MTNYKTPGVYVEESPTLPPSVAEVSTAIPAFIGYTEKGPKLEPTRISTLLEYETLFGYAQLSSFALKGASNEIAPGTSNPPDFLMHYSLQLYFQNGGGSCYVVSIGHYLTDSDSPTKTVPTRDDFAAGIDQLETEDEPTLILFPDAVKLSDPQQYYGLCQKALAQCEKLKDRFCILDVLNGSNNRQKVSEFREGVANNHLKYGAAYHPYLQTSLSYAYKDELVTLDTVTFEKTFEKTASGKGILVRYTGNKTDNPAVTIQAKTGGTPEPFTITSHTLTITTGTDATDAIADSKGITIVNAWKKWVSQNDAQGFEITDNAGGDDEVKPGSAALLFTFEKTLSPNSITVKYTGAIIDQPQVLVAHDPAKTTATFSSASKALTITIASTLSSTKIAQDWKDLSKSGELLSFAITVAGNGNDTPTPSNTQLYPPSLESIKSSDTARYNQIKAALTKQYVTLPPSPAIAGIYASVDRERGVWKAPANVSVASVIGPVTKITNEEQDDLNVDPTSGKSVNAIRAFTGKGTMVWGARTLAGNDNEWRYVNVRRLFNVIEESIQKATAFAVFESNDATTWLKVKAMIESYLFGLWEQGALAGPTPVAAYFVNVGLGKTMTTQDILEGRMKVKVGVAAVRPAEFIILTFTHKLQEA